MARARPSSLLDPLDRLFGAEPALHTLRAQIRHLARFDAVGHAAVPTVLLQGETGTGKGLVARVIHDSGPRAHGPFIEVDCGAIPEGLLESELFGVEARTFTDAKRAKPGLFEAASGGTLFLDEITSLLLALQGKCLTAIEDKRLRWLGAVVEHAIDVKLIAAIPVALSAQVEAGYFRADLYHRLAVVVLELPPLRERGDDILVLVCAFLQQYSAAYEVSPQRLSKAAEAWLLAYHWPGNVREVSHLLERVVLLEAATVIDPESLARRYLSQPGPAVPVDAQLPPRAGEPRSEPERLADALRQSGGNLDQMARLLGMSRGDLRYRLCKSGLTPPSVHQSSTLVEEEPDGREPPRPFSTPTLTLPRPGGGETPAQRIPPQDASTETVGPAAGWEPKPVAVLVIEATWPERAAAEAGPYKPWTLASRWEQSLTEKVTGFGGVILHGSPLLCLVAFGLPWTLEQLPQRAIQAALAIRHLAAEAASIAGEAGGPIVRLAGHLGTLLVAAEHGATPSRWLALGETLALPVRLLGHAVPGELLVSSPMARLTDGWVDMQTRRLSAGAEPSDALLVQGVLAARIDRLSAKEKALLQTLAVIGSTCAQSLLQRVVEQPEAVLQQYLPPLQGAEFLYAQPAAPEPAYTFKHILIQGVAYHSLPQERKQALHERTARTIEALADDRLTEKVEQLTHHAFRGEVWEKALAYSRQAGARAATHSAYRETVTYFEQALAALQHLPKSRDIFEQTIDLQLDLRSALLLLTGFERMSECLREAQAIADALGDQRRLGRVLSYLAHLLQRLHEHDRAIASGRRVLTIAVDIGGLSLQVATNFFLGQIPLGIGNYRDAAPYFRSIVDCFEGDRLRDRFGMVALLAMQA